MALSESAAKLFARASCVECPAPPTCPPCGATETCTLSIRTCDACPKTSCVATNLAGAVAQQPTKNTGSNAKNTGAIAGGAVGAVAAILLLTYLIWRFLIRDKKRAQMLEDEDEYPVSTFSNRGEKDNHVSFAMQRDHRASTHTTHSVATTMTRNSNVSNIIQIAYIPGVTGPGMSPGHDQLIPPVPPLPGASPDQFLFMPGDMRDSSLSGVSMHDGGFHNRSSVATTIYGANAVITPVAAQTITRANAAVVSVGPKTESLRSSNPSVASREDRHASTDTRINSNTLELPIMPPFSPMSPLSADIPPPSPAFSIGSTFLSNAQSAVPVTAKPILVTRSNSKATSRPAASSPLSPQSPPTAVPTSAVDGHGSLIDNFPQPTSATRESGITFIETDSPDRASRFSARHASRMTNSSMASIPLFAVFEEGTPRIPSLPAAIKEEKRTDSPFDDKHEVKE